MRKRGDSGGEGKQFPRQNVLRINDNISSTIVPAATILIVISLLLMIVVGWLQRRSTRMRQSDG